MTVRFVRGAVTATALICAGAIFSPAHAQTRDGGLLPANESATITVVGCFQRIGEEGKKYVLARPRLGPINSVPEESCSATADDSMLELEHEGKTGMNESILGRWIEINGRLEKEESDDPENLRELHVRSFRVVPVVPPRPEPTPMAQAPREPEVRYVPQPTPAPAPTPTMEPPATPVGTSGVRKRLPKTASELPAIGFVGLLSLGGGLVLLWRRALGRG